MIALLNFDKDRGGWNFFGHKKDSVGATFDEWWNGDPTKKQARFEVPESDYADRWNDIQIRWKQLGDNQNIDTLIKNMTQLDEAERRFLLGADIGKSTVDDYTEAMKRYNAEVDKNNESPGVIGVKGKIKETFTKSIIPTMKDLAVSAGISLAISGAIKLADELIVTQAESAAAAQKVTDAYRRENESISKGRETIASIGGEYLKLNEGVDAAGQNISLSSEAFERHNALAKQIADILPEMVSGYDSLGRPILKAVNNIKEFNDALDEQHKKANNTLIGKGQELFEGFDKNGAGTFFETGIQEQINLINDVLSGNESKYMFSNNTGMAPTPDYAVILKKAGVSSSNFSGNIVEKAENRAAIESYKHQLMAEMQGWNSQIADYAVAYMENMDGFDDINDQLKGSMNTVLKGYDFGGKGMFDQASVNNFVSSMVEHISSQPQKILDQIDKAQRLSSKKGISATKWQAKMTKILSELGDSTGLAIDDLAKALDLQVNAHGEVLTKAGYSVSTMLGKLSAHFNKENSAFDELSITELSNAYDIVTDKVVLFTGSLKQLKERLKLVDAAFAPTTIKEYAEALESANAGADYISIDEGLKNTKDLWNKGLVGTDEFKSFARMISPKQYKDEQKYIDNYLKNYKTMQKYFTEDHKGPKRMLDKLVDSGNLDKLADGTYVGMIEDTNKAAKELGLSTYTFEQILYRLKDYGFDIDFTSSTEKINQANDALMGLQDIWEDMEAGAGKRALGKEIEDYRQELLKAQEAGNNIPDHLIKEIEFKVNTEQLEHDIAYAEEQIKNGYGDTRDQQNLYAETLIKQEELSKIHEDELGIDSVKDIKGKANKINFSQYKSDIANKEEILHNLTASGTATAEEILSAQKALVDARDTYLGFLGQLSKGGKGSPTQVDNSYDQIKKKLLSPTKKIKKILKALNELSLDDLEAIDLSDGQYSDGEKYFEDLIYNLHLSKENADTLLQVLREIREESNKPTNSSFSTKTPFGFLANRIFRKPESEGSEESVYEDNVLPQNRSVTYNLEQSPELVDYETARHELFGMVTFGKDSTEVDNYHAPDQDANVKFHPQTSLIDNAINRIKSKIESFTPKPKKKGKDAVNGTAHARGTAPIIKGAAFSGGNWGTKKSETALTGELGPEIVVRGSDYFVTGTNGAEFTDIKKGDIIFNHKQTKALLENGYVTGRGKAYAGGSEGTLKGQFGGGIGKHHKKNKDDDEKKRAKARKRQSDKESKDSKDKFSEFFDWIERRVKKLQGNFDKWVHSAETALTSGFINMYYKAAAKNSAKLMQTQYAAYHRYLKKANSSAKKNKINSKYRSKVRNGLIDLETIKNEKKAKGIQKYQEFYDKAVDAMNAFRQAAEEFYNIPLESATKKIERFTEAIELLDLRTGNAIGHAKKNTLVDKKTSEQRHVYIANKTAYDQADANFRNARRTLLSRKSLGSEGVSKAERQRIQNAARASQEVNLGYFKEGTAGYNAAVKYNEALKARTKAQYEYNKAGQEYIAWQREAAKIKFDNVATDFEHQISFIEEKNRQIESRISNAESAGMQVSRQYYQMQHALNNERKADLEKEKAALESYLTKIPQGTEEWYDAYKQICDVNAEIAGCVDTTHELNKAITETEFNLHSNIHNEIDRLMAEQEFLRGLFAHEKKTSDETGDFTDAGLANMASTYASYVAATHNAENSKNVVSQLDNMISKGILTDGNYRFNSVEELEAKREEMYDQWRSDIQSVYSLETELVDAMKEKYQAQLDMMSKLISDKKEALQLEKDLHDYQNTINEKTKNIATLKKRQAAYAGDTSEEAKSKLQRLNKELLDAEKDLQETEYDKYISDQSDMLDRLYENYEELVNKKFEDFKGLFQEATETANANASLANDYLLNIAKAYGYAGTGEEGNLITKTGSIDSQVGTIITQLTNTEKVLNNPPATPPENSPTGNPGGSGTPNTGTPTGTPNTNSGGGSTANNPSKPPSKTPTDASPYRETINRIDAYIKRHASPAKKKYKDLSDVNKVIYGTYNKKVLSVEEMEALTKYLGYKFDNATSKGKLYRKLHALKFPGFASGGTVVSVEDINKKIRANGDDGIASVKRGEAILTPVDSKNLELLAGKLPQLSSAVDIMSHVVKVPSFGQTSMNTFGDITFNFELPNVHDPKDFVHAIQTNKQLQSAIQDVSIKQLSSGANKLTVNRHR